MGGRGGGGGGGVTLAGEPLMTASTNLEHMELSITRDTASSANTAHVSRAGGQKMFAFKSSYVNAPVHDGWIYREGRGREGGEVGDKSRVMASLPRLRESTLGGSYGKKQCLFSLTTTTTTQKGKIKGKKEKKRK